MIHLNFIDVNGDNDKYKATIHQTGKLGFNIEAKGYMDLSGDKCFKIAFEPESSNIERIYLVEWWESDGVLKVNKAGDYYFLKLTNVLNRMKVNYKRYVIGFSIVKSEDPYIDGEGEGHDMYILTKNKEKIRKDQELPF